MEVITIFGTTCALISIPQGTTPWWGTSIQTNEYSKSRICHQSDIPSYSYLPNLQTKSLSNLPISTLPPQCEVSTLLLLRLLPYFFCMPAASVTTAGLGMTNPERWCNSLITVGIGVIYSWLEEAYCFDGRVQHGFFAFRDANNTGPTVRKPRLSQLLLIVLFCTSFRDPGLLKRVLQMMKLP